MTVQRRRALGRQLPMQSNPLAAARLHDLGRRHNCGVAADAALKAALGIVSSPERLTCIYLPCQYDDWVRSNVNSIGLKNWF
jgi:hypothetical protein